MNPLTLRTLALLPVADQEKIRAHKYRDELDELVQNAWLARLETGTGSGDTMRSPADRARSRTRRRKQDPACYGRPLDGIAANDKHKQPTLALKKREIVQEVAADFGVTTRRGLQIVSSQIERAKMGDLFIAGDGSGDEDDGEDE